MNLAESAASRRMPRSSIPSGDPAVRQREISKPRVRRRWPFSAGFSTISEIVQGPEVNPSDRRDEDFVKEIAAVLRPQDEIWMSEIFYAGGTAVKDISANDLIEDLNKA